MSGILRIFLNNKRYFSDVKIKPVISVTENAWKKINTILSNDKNNNNKSMLLDIKSGGCNGFNYIFTTFNSNETRIKDADKYNKYSIVQSPFNKDNKIYIEPIAEFYVLGTKIDYVQEDYSKNIFESKFIFIPDKNLATNCGCGISFSLKN